jgi:transcriptional regulator with XRE-family HTH domain
MPNWNDLAEEAFAINVRRRRIALGWSQADLAERMTDMGWPLHQTQVAKIEAGPQTRRVRLVEAITLAGILGDQVETMIVRPDDEELTLEKARSEVTALLERANRLVREMDKTLRELVEAQALIPNLQEQLNGMTNEYEAVLQQLTTVAVTAKLNDRGRQMISSLPEPMSAARFSRIGGFSPAERRVAHVVFSEPEVVAFGTVAEVARRAKTSGTSVNRFYTALGYGSFAELKAEVQAQLAGENSRPSEEDKRRKPTKKDGK